jgi:hypothetical protein
VTSWIAERVFSGTAPRPRSSVKRLFCVEPRSRLGPMLSGCRAECWPPAVAAPSRRSGVGFSWPPNALPSSVMRYLTLKGWSGSANSSSHVSLIMCSPQRTWVTSTVPPAGTTFFLDSGFQFSSPMPL